MLAVTKQNQNDRLDPDMVKVLQEKTGAERLAIASRMFASARRMLSSHLQSLHPEWDRDRVLRETARRISLGPG